MIFVILGTQDKKFTRLLDAIEKQIELGNISKDEKVIVQSGSTDYKSSYMEIKDYIDLEEFEKILKEADLVISHAGVGTITTALKMNKKIIAAARLKKYDEHVNDHQIQLLESFEKQGYLMALYDFDKLDQVLISSKDFKPKEFKSNQKNFIEQLEKNI